MCVVGDFVSPHWCCVLDVVVNGCSGCCGRGSGGDDDDDDDGGGGGGGDDDDGISDCVDDDDGRCCAARSRTRRTCWTPWRRSRGDTE